MKNSYWLWIIALIVVNTGWYAVSQQGAVQEINRPGADFSESREGKLSTIIGSEVDYEIEHCFESINGGVHNASITIESDSEVLYSWEGDTDKGCITYSSTAGEGEFVVITIVDEGVDTTTTMTTWPMKNAFVMGLILFSLCTVAVAFGETFVRALVKKKMEQTHSANTPQIESFSQSNGIWQDPVRPN